MKLSVCACVFVCVCVHFVAYPPCLNVCEKPLFLETVDFTEKNKRTSIPINVHDITHKLYVCKFYIYL